MPECWNARMMRAWKTGKCRRMCENEIIYECNKKTSFFLQEFIYTNKYKLIYKRKFFKKNDGDNGKRNLITRISMRYGYDFILYNFSFIPSLDLFSLSTESYPVTHTHTCIYINRAYTYMQLSLSHVLLYEKYLFWYH